MQNQNFKPWEIINQLRKSEVNTHVAKLASEIEELQKKFDSPDYKTTKNLQYERMGLELPYSWEEIYEEAEAIRVKIREKEQEIENLLDLTRPVEAPVVENTEESVDEATSESVTE